MTATVMEPGGRSVRPRPPNAGRLVSRKRVYPVLGVLIVLGVWQALPGVGLVDPYVLPPPTDVLAAIPGVLSDGAFRKSLGVSATWWGTGLVVGVSAGLLLGVLMGRSRAVFLALNPILGAAYATPKVALVVPLVLLFGINSISMGGVVALGALAPVVTAGYQGARRVNKQYLWSASALGIGPRWLLWRVVLPASLPDILSGIRVAIGFSLLTLLGAEFVIRQGGVGAFLYSNLDLGQFVRVWAIGIILGTSGYLVDLVYSTVVGRAFRWAHTSA
jgi:ABC-type nitrate/sulfonate/bicarbonate transport system permease component